MLRYSRSSSTFSPWLQCLQREIAKCNSIIDSNDPSGPPHTVCTLGSAGTLQAGNIAILPAFTANSNVSSHARQEINLATEHLNNSPYRNWKMFPLFKLPIYNIFSKEIIIIIKTPWNSVRVLFGYISVYPFLSPTFCKWLLPGGTFF